MTKQYKKGGFKNKQFENYRNGIVKDRNRLLISAYESDRVKLALLSKCRQDVVFFVNYFIYTYNPREENPYLPMILFKRQEQMLKIFQEAYDSGRWCIVNKSRYTGASVISISFMLHKFLFEEGFSGSLSSNKADSVDKIGDPDCLFAKLEQMYEMLPSWMKPFPAQNYRKIKLFVNPTNGSNIKGYSGRDIGRGGRSSLAFVDEIAHLDHGDSAIAAMSENTDCLLGVSTPKGKDNQHYRLFTNPEILSFTFSWKDDPRRDVEWARKQKIKLGEEIFEQELNCSFDAFQSSAYLPSRLVDCLFEESSEYPTLYNTSYQSAPRFAGLDIALGGDNTILCIVEENRVIALYKLDPDIKQAIAQMLDICQRHSIQGIAYDQCGLGQMFGALTSEISGGHLPFLIEPYNASKLRDVYLPHRDQEAKDCVYNNRALYYDTLYNLANNTYNYLEGNITNDQALSDHPVLFVNQDVKYRSELREDLLKAGFSYRNGKLLIESKQDMKKRGLSSTDYSDSLICALYMRDISSF